MTQLDDNVPLWERAKRAADQVRPESHSLDDTATLAGLAVGVGLSAATLAHIKDLLDGRVITYKAILSARELGDRLRSKLSTKKVAVASLRSDSITVYVSARGAGATLAQILVGVVGEQSTVQISALNTDRIQEMGGQLKDSALDVVKSATRRGDILGSIIDLGGQALDAAMQVSGDLGIAELIASTIDEYGAEEERRADEVRREERRKEEEKEQAEEAKKKCPQCGAVRVPGEKVCSGCGQPFPQD